MTQPQPTKRLFNVIAAIVFIMGAAMFSYMNVADWLPALIIIAGVAVIVRQLLQGKTLDVMVCFVIFGGAFFCSFFNFMARIFLPAFLVLGSVYYILRQFFEFGIRTKRSEKIPHGEEPPPSDTPQI